MHERCDLPDRLAQSGNPPRAHEDHLSYLENYFKYRSFPYEVSAFVAPDKDSGGESSHDH
mgnify:CR=1 FL=1